MPDTHIAEWILSLVTSQDRAASTAGDLTEEAMARGTAWFWSSVLRTAASLLWHDVLDYPARLARLAFLGLAVYIGIDLLFAGLSGVAFFLAALANGRGFPTDTLAWKIWFAIPVLVSSLLIGRILARWAPGRELAACLAYAVLAAIYNLIPMLGDNGALATWAGIVLVLAGAAWGRNRRLSLRGAA